MSGLLPPFTDKSSICKQSDVSGRRFVSKGGQSVKGGSQYQGEDLLVACCPPNTPLHRKAMYQGCQGGKRTHRKNIPLGMSGDVSKRCKKQPPLLINLLLAIMVMGLHLILTNL